MNKQTLIKAAQNYAKELARVNTKIYEIVLIGSLVNGGFKNTSDIDIVCLFNPDPDPDPTNPQSGWSLISNLRDQVGHTLEGYPVDLGFVSGTSIFLGGLIEKYRGNHVVLYNKEGDQTFGETKEV